MRKNAIIDAVLSWLAGNGGPGESFDWKYFVSEDTEEAFENLSEAEKAEFEALLPEAAARYQVFHDDWSDETRWELYTEEEIKEEYEQDVEECRESLYDVFSSFIED